jgi:opacity protein-like surface antigen
MAPKRLLPILLAVALASAFAAHAQTTPFYVGAAIGQSKASSDLVRDRESNIAPGTPSTLATSADLKDTVGKVWVGWQALSWLAVEAGYADHGSQKIATDYILNFGGIVSTGTVTTDREVKGWGADLVASFMPMPTLKLFGKVGAFRADISTETRVSNGGSFQNPIGDALVASKTETVVKYGLGADYSFTKNVSARLEWERLPKIGQSGSAATTGEADQDSFWLGVNYRL